LHGTKLDVAVRNRNAMTPWQPADAGDATIVRPSTNLSIAALGASHIVGDVSIHPNPFTPNGDLINDEARIEFSLFKVYKSRPTVLRIYTLDGHTVRNVEGVAQGGRHRLTWDGRDADGKTVPPGLYICQIDVQADAEGVDGQRRVHLIAVAY
jgi:hypothetical protein